jgi:hypothetical protein
LRRRHAATGREPSAGRAALLAAAGARYRTRCVFFACIAERLAVPAAAHAATRRRIASQAGLLELVAFSLRLWTEKFDRGGAHSPALALTVSVDIQFQNITALLCEGSQHD